MKLYRYRSNNSFLFKELKYKEIYLARYSELNDPQDLSCVINFYSTDKDKVNALGYFLHRRMIDAHGIRNFIVLRDSFTPKKLGTFLFEKFSGFDSEVVTQDELRSLLYVYYKENTKDKQFSSLGDPSVDQLFSAILSTTDLFLKNASVACFSESNNNFLMWSHYAGGHDGVCLGFEAGLFTTDKEEKVSRYGILSTVDFIYEGKPVEFWTEIHKVFL